MKMSFRNIVCVYLLLMLVFTGCSGTTENTGYETTADVTKTPSVTAAPTSEGEESIITIGCGEKSASGTGTVLLELGKSIFKTGAVIDITLPEGEHYLAVSISKDYIDETIVYLPSGKFSYTIPNLSYSYPTELKRVSKHTVSARIPSEDELLSSQNIAKNPLDLIENDDGIKAYDYAYWSGEVYPHASTSSVCRLYESEESKYQFEARNAIDGMVKNSSHGGYPYQSWGPDSNFSEKDGYIMIDFGHEVVVEDLDLYIRADFPHDTYFNGMKVEFSDGSTKTFKIEKSGDKQVFELGEKNTTYIKLTRLTKEDHSGWAAITEIEVIGHHVAG